MRLMTIASMVMLIALSTAGAGEIERTVAYHVRSIVPADGTGGVPVALRIGGRTLFFNYGWAKSRSERTTTSTRSREGVKAVFNVTAMERSILAELSERGGSRSIKPAQGPAADRAAGQQGIRRTTHAQRSTKGICPHSHWEESSRQQVDKDRCTAEQREGRQ
jgi:hypothetical protein